MTTTTAARMFDPTCECHQIDEPGRVRAGRPHRRRQVPGRRTDDFDAWWDHVARTCTESMRRERRLARAAEADRCRCHQHHGHADNCPARPRPVITG